MSKSLQRKMLTGGGKALAILLVLLVSLGAVACRNDVPAEDRGSLNIIVTDAASKTIAYEPADGYPGAMSHYTVVVKDSGGASVGTSDYMELENGEGRFEVTNLVTGTYTIDVSGYIKTGETAYTLIATGTEKATVGASYANDLVVAIDTFDDAYTGDMTVELVMPIDAVENGTITGELSWTLVSVDDSSLSFTGSETLTAAALDDGKYTLTIADKNVPGGRYLLTATFDNGSDYSGIDAVIAYPGLPSTGTRILIKSSNSEWLPGTLQVRCRQDPHHGASFFLTSYFGEGIRESEGESVEILTEDKSTSGKSSRKPRKMRKRKRQEKN